MILVVLGTKTISTACNHLTPSDDLSFSRVQQDWVWAVLSRDPAGESELFGKRCLTHSEAAGKHSIRAPDYFRD